MRPRGGHKRHFLLSNLKVAGAFIDDTNVMRKINPDVWGSPAPTHPPSKPLSLSLSLISGCVPSCLNTACFRWLDTFTCQVDAEQQSSQLFSHGTVNAAATGLLPGWSHRWVHLPVGPRSPSLRFCRFGVSSCVPEQNTCCSGPAQPCVMQARISEQLAAGSLLVALRCACVTVTSAHGAF